MPFSELINQKANSLFQVVAECALELASIAVVKCSETLSSSTLPLTLENSLDALAFAFSLKPVVASQSTRSIIFPLSFVFFQSCIPIHHSLPLLLVLPPKTFVFVARLVFHFSKPFSKSCFELSLINSPIGKSEHSSAFLHSFFPCAFVTRFIDRAIVLSISIPFSLLYATWVEAAIRPSQFSLASEGILADITLINQSILPSIKTPTVHESIFEPSSVWISIEELHTSNPVETFVIDTVLKLTTDVTVPSLVVLCSDLQRQERRLILNLHIFYNRIELHPHLLFIITQT